ncbi:hypothetical protein JOB18_011780 [Solea senegalensis]|uniref:Uncharacterized protein n=1 Tax=Solea senegalensis TaxID=28829 RepID=A0AAV6SXV1_SOLSE|nr:hypothetical protein JOB18_011780 [Solea senegalensis]
MVRCYGSEMGFDLSHRHRHFGQQVESWTDRLAIASASWRLPDMLLKPGWRKERQRCWETDRDVRSGSASLLFPSSLLLPICHRPLLEDFRGHGDLVSGYLLEV